MKCQVVKYGQLVLSILLLLTLSRCNEPRITKGSPMDAFITKLNRLSEDKRHSAVQDFLELHPETPVFPDDSTVFIYYYGNANSVRINGNCFNSWSDPRTLQRIDCGDSNFFYAMFSLPPDSRIDYQFIVDDQYQVDPRNPVITPSGYGPHSQIAMPEFIPSPFLLSNINIAVGMVDTIFFSSKDDSIASRELLVYKPAGFREDERYPVIYILDGREAIEYMNYPVVIENMTVDGLIPPLLAVFIPPGNRFREYIDGVERFAKSFCEEIIPLIDGQYPTIRDPGSRAISGISAGGHAALFIPLLYPDVCLQGAGQSASISEKLLDFVREFSPEAGNSPHWKFWLDGGRYDLPSGLLKAGTFTEAIVLYHETLTGKGIENKLMIVNDGHEWANWRERTDDILQFFFGQSKNAI